MTIQIKKQVKKNKHTSDQYFNDIIIPTVTDPDHPEKDFLKLPVIQQRIIRELLKLKDCEEIYPSQTTLAEKVGVKRRPTVNKHMGEICEKGWLAKLSQGEGSGKSSCIYKIADCLKNPSAAMKKVLFTLGIVFYTTYLCSSDREETGRSTQIKNNFIYKIVFTNTRDSNTVDNLDKYISNSIKSRNLINLTDEMKALLTCYPEQVINYGFSNLRGIKSFGYLKKIMDNYATLLGLKINYSKYYWLKDKFNLKIEIPQKKSRYEPYSLPTQNIIPTKQYLLKSAEPVPQFITKLSSDCHTTQDFLQRVVFNWDQIVDMHRKNA